MASASVIIGVVFVMLLLGVGVAQQFGAIPHSTLAGAATVNAPPKGPTQSELNVCIKSCMTTCVQVPGDEKPCLAKCESECGA